MKVVSIIGLGRVGRAVAFLLSALPEPLLINLVDPWLNPGTLLDLAHAHTRNRLVENSRELLAESHVVFHCAGPEVPPGESRLAVRDRSYELTDSIFSGLAFPHPGPLLIVLSNPVDLITLRALEVTDLPPERVLGTGSLLDTRRFNLITEQYLRLERGSVEALLLGEHGESCAVWTEGSLINGTPLKDTLNPAELKGLLQDTLRQAARIKEDQGATYYGVARCAVDLMNGYFDQEKTVSVASILCPPEFAEILQLEKPLCLSLPVVLGQRELLVRPPRLQGSDLENLRRSAHTLSQARGKFGEGGFPA